MATEGIAYMDTQRECDAGLAIVTEPIYCKKKSALMGSV